MTDRFLRRDVGQIAPDLCGETLGVSPPEARIGRSYGPWTIVEVLGEGGMGQIFLVERSDGQYEMLAALKLLAGDADPTLAERFRLERQILARLDHPHLARLLDGGTTDDGEPWFVMERIEGDPIDAWCDERGLDIRGRLRLFLQVCSAVTHAHRRLVVHRDIKPGNVLIDSEGKARLLDFGIAHPLEESASSDATRAVRALTAGFAAPEQIRGEAASTATDVYALGAFLHCLLTGRPPFHDSVDAETTLQRSLFEPPPLPSSVVESGDRARELRGDLDAIVVKALDKEPADRYATVDELAGDVIRFLDHVPVIARAATPGIRLRKALRRHRLGAALAIVGIALLASFLIVGWSRMREAERERERAERVTAFLTEVLAVGDPAAGGGFVLEADELLHRAFDRAETELADRPAVQAAVFHQVGELLGRLGLPEDAREALLRAIEIRRELAPRGSPELAASLARYGYSFQYSPRAVEGVVPLRESVEISRRLFGKRDPRTADALFDFAVYTSRLIPADRYPPELAPESARSYEEALEIFLLAHGEGHRKVAATLHNMAFVREDPAERVRLLERAIAAHEAWDPSSPELAYALSDLGLIRDGQGRAGEAERTLRRSLEILRSREDDDARVELTIANNLAGVLRDQGRYSEAVPLYREVLERRDLVTPENDRTRAFTLYGLGRSLLGLGESAEAETNLRAAATLLEKVGDQGLSGVAWGWVAEALAAQGRHSEGVPVARQSHRTLAAAWGEDHEETEAARDRLERLSLDTGRLDSEDSPTSLRGGG